MEPAVTAAIVGVVGTAVLGFIAWLGRKLYRKWNAFWDRIDRLEERADTAARRNEKLLSILFGREVDESDDGLTAEVQDGFDDLADGLDNLDESIDELDGAISVVIISLHEEEDIDFDKDDLEYTAELRRI